MRDLVRTVPVRIGAAGLALFAGLGALSACSSPKGPLDRNVAPGSYRLVAFDSCADALSNLRAAGKQSVGPYGFGGVWATDGGAATGAQRDLAGAPLPAQQNAAPEAVKGTGAQPAAGDGYSGTNNNEAGVDEPDLVKTDGHRIVTVSGSTLRVIDAASRTVTGTLDLNTNGVSASADELLLAGDRALVLARYPYRYRADGAGGVAVQGPAGTGDRAVPDAPGPLDPIAEPGPVGPRFVLVSLAGQPRVLSSVAVDGNLVDARQVGATARVVIGSAPRLQFPMPQPNQETTEAQRTAVNQGIIDKAPIDEWLPRIETTTGGATHAATVDCSAISRPASYTGGNLVTILTFDLGAANLGDGQPTVLVADGDTVYSNGPSLYVASNRWQQVKPVAADTAAPQVTTEIYRFDTPGNQRPTFAAGGGVPGSLINQYAMSELDGKLRVATTSQTKVNASSTSGVYVLAQEGRTLKQVGSVEGLGKGEQIYSVRFIGPIGYVVTFRQTDPLYTVDLSDPAKPTVRGQLKIPGYSAYLHPAGGNRLIGIGQSATDQGRTTGAQVSLFDISNVAVPGLMAQYTVSGAHSEAEFDPHAFLYWPATGLLVVPLQTAYRVNPGAANLSRVQPPTGALVLRVSEQDITEVGFIQHPGGMVQVRRSLVIGQTLWTVSDTGLMASNLTSLAQQAWIPLR